MRAISKHRASFAIALVVFGYAWTAPSYSQALEEVVVTAQRREQSEQKVPISISTYTGEQMRALGIVSTTDIANQAPGVLMVSTATGNVTVLPTIRGVSQNDYSAFQEMPNAVYVDQAYVAPPGAIGFNLFDMQRSEVLRGPQGTLFGRNATGGAIQFVSAAPTRDDTGYVDVSYGSYSEVRIEAAASGSLADNVQGRLSFLSDEHGPWWKNEAPPTVSGGNGDSYAANNIAGRGQLQFELSDSATDLLSVTRAVDRHHAEGAYKSIPGALNSQGLGYAIPANQNVNGTCPGCDYFGYRDPNINTPFESSFNDVGYIARQYWNGTNKLTIVTIPFTFTSVTNYQKFSFGYLEDTDGTPYDVARYPQSLNMHQQSQEFRFNGGDDHLNWTAGAYYFGSTENLVQGYSTGLAPTDPLAAFAFTSVETLEQETRSYAAFGQLEYQIVPDVTLTTGLRWSHDRKDFQSITIAPGTPNVVLYDFTTATVGDQTLANQGALSGKIGLDWKAAPDLLLYASISRGFKGPGFNGTPTGPPPTGFAVPYQGEELTDYETGWKWQWWGGKARLNGSLYYYDYHNYQAFDLVGLSTVIENKDATMYGSELEFEVQPAEGWYVSLGASLEQGTVKDVRLPLGDIVDRLPPEMPKVTADGAVRREWTLPVGKIGLQFDGRYNGWRYASVSNAPDTLLPGAAIFNARLTYAEGAHWDAALSVKNLANRGVVTYVFDDVAFYGSYVQSYQPPRWITADVRYRW
jgi:iron complex outermembrane receptor protein